MKQRQLSVISKHLPILNGKLQFTLSLAFYILFSGMCEAQTNSTLSKKETHERDSLMAISILNLDSDFVFIEGGAFQMGLPDTSAVEGSDIEKPQHKVTLKNFYILKSPVTQALWYAVMDSNPAFHKNCYTCPVENVSWNDAQRFITTLNQLTKGHYRLPSEAEFEYAARGGKKSKGFDYSGSNDVKDVAWYTDNSLDKSHPVGEKKPNELGLVDMSGNIWEWCSDWFAMYYYKNSPTDNPQGPTRGEKKVLRGGGWLSLDEGCLVISRGALMPSFKDKFTGFRIVKD